MHHHHCIQPQPGTRPLSPLTLSHLVLPHAPCTAPSQIVTLVTVVGTLLLIPLVLAGLNIPSAAKLYDYDMGSLPMP